MAGFISKAPQWESIPDCESKECVELCKMHKDWLQNQQAQVLGNANVLHGNLQCFIGSHSGWHLLLQSYPEHDPFAV